MIDILSHFEKVREHGQNHWTACCPAHPDKTPSLSITLADDGRWLLHDFGGCDISAILAAAALTFADIQPERLVDHLPPVRRAFSDAQLLRSIGHEALVVALCASDIARTGSCSDQDRARVFQSCKRIQAAMEYRRETI